LPIHIVLKKEHIHNLFLYLAKNASCTPKMTNLF
jgi:hypothetical protein